MMLNVVVVGTSGHALRNVLPVLKQPPDISLRGVISSNPERARSVALEYGTRSYRSILEAGSDAEVGAFWIAAPNNLHAALARDAVLTRRHVLVEKPLALQYKDSLDLVALSEQLGVVLKVGYQHRFHESHSVIRSLCSDGTLGRLGFVSIHRQWKYPYFEDMPVSPPAWRTDPLVSGGWASNDIGSHLIDLMGWLTTTRPVGVSGVITNHTYSVDADDGAVLVMELRGAERETAGSPPVGTVQVSNALTTTSSLLEMYGLSGWLRAEGTFEGGGTVTTHSGSLRFDDTPIEEIFRRQANDFAAAVRGEPSIGATATDAAQQVQVQDWFMREAKRV